jgi:protein SERAC1
VHGLGGNRKTTWAHQNKIYWPQDLLPKQFPHARIMTFGYDADMVKIWSTGLTGSNGLHDHGKSLAFSVADSRSTLASKRRPLIFVVHSLGGLVCEQALLVCRASNEQRLAAVLESTVGIVFMGTPHKGSELAKWGSRVATYLQHIRKVNKKIVETLKVKSEVLASVEQDFQQLLLKPEHKEKTRIFCFYEEIAIPFVGTIVPKESAILAQYSNASIHANHMDMARFSSEADNGYLSICGVLKDWIDTLEKLVDEDDLMKALPPDELSITGTAVQDRSMKDMAGQVQTIDLAGNRNIMVGGAGQNLPSAISGVITTTGGPTFVGSNVSGNTFKWGSSE